MSLCCEKLRINGVLTHEIGCPEAWKSYRRECQWCGESFKPKQEWQILCSVGCLESYLDQPAPAYALDWKRSLE